LRNQKSILESLKKKEFKKLNQILVEENNNLKIQIKKPRKQNPKLKTENQSLFENN
jgi:hypothetical protein